MSALASYAACDNSVYADTKTMDYESNNNQFTRNCLGAENEVMLPPKKPKRRRKRKRRRSPKNPLKQQTTSVVHKEVYMVPTRTVTVPVPMTVTEIPRLTTPVKAGPGYGPSRAPKALKPVSKQVYVMKEVQVPLVKPVAKIPVARPVQQFSQTLLQNNLPFKPLPPSHFQRIQQENDALCADLQRKMDSLEMIQWEAQERIRKQIGEAQDALNMHAERMLLSQQKANEFKRSISLNSEMSGASSMSSDRYHLRSDVSESAQSDRTDGSSSRKDFVSFETSMQMMVNISPQIEHELEIFDEVPELVSPLKLTEKLLKQASLSTIELAEKIQKHASYENKRVHFSEEQNTYFSPKFTPNKDLFFSFEDEERMFEEREREEMELVCPSVEITFKLAGPGRARRSLHQCDCEIHQQQPQHVLPLSQHLFACECRYCKLFEHHFECNHYQEEEPYSPPPIKRRARNLHVPVNIIDVDAEPDFVNRLEEAVQTVSEEREDDRKVRSQMNAAALGLFDKKKIPDDTQSVETSGTAGVNSVRQWGDKKWSQSDFENMQNLQRSKRMDEAWASTKSLVNQEREPTPDKNDDGWVPCGAPNLRMTNLPQFGYDYTKALNEKFPASCLDRRFGIKQNMTKDIINGFKRDARQRVKDWFFSKNIRLNREDRIGISIKQDFNDSNRYFLATGWITFEDTKQRFKLAEWLVNSKEKGEALTFGNNLVEFSWAWQDPKKYNNSRS